MYCSACALSLAGVGGQRGKSSNTGGHWDKYTGENTGK